MNKRFLSIATLLLAFVLSGCTSPAGVTNTQPASSEQVGTVVAMTLQALIPTAAETPTVVSDAATSLLPHSLYFLGRDNQSLNQLYRMERDGKTIMQLTYEPVSVVDYDISRVDGSVVYEVDNQLVMINADGSNRLVLVEGIPNPDVTRGYYHPVFAPDGQTLAYNRSGINLYTVSTGVASLVLENQLIEEPEFHGRESYSPEQFSPDGTKLVVHLLYSDTSAMAIYYPASNSLVRLTCAADNHICSDGSWFYSDIEWSADSSSFYAAVPTATSIYAGDSLWKVDAATGAVISVTPSTTGDGLAIVPKELHHAPDGQMYFFFGTYDVNSGFFDAPEMKLVRSEPDGVTNRTVLRDENFVLMQDALWAPDASFAIVASAPTPNWDQEGGVLELYYADGEKSIVWLAPHGQQLKWGP
jgi:hypothetical protein